MTVPLTRNGFLIAITPIPSFIPDVSNYNTDCNNARERHAAERETLRTRGKKKSEKQEKTQIREVMS